VTIVGVGGSGSKTVVLGSARAPGAVRIIAIDTEESAPFGICETVALGNQDVISERLAYLRLKADWTLDQDSIRHCLTPSDIVVIVAGMGGETGTVIAPIIADVAACSGAVTLAIATTPFSFEGAQRVERARDGLNTLAGKVDSIVTIDNNRLLTAFGPGIAMDEAFRLVQESVNTVIRRIVRALVAPGLIKLDISAVKSMLRGGGATALSAGTGSGPERGKSAVQSAVVDSMLGRSLRDARRVFWCLSGDDSVSIAEAGAVGNEIHKFLHPDAKVFFDVQRDSDLRDTVEVAILANAFEETNNLAVQFPSDKEYYRRLGMCLKQSRLENKKTQRECARFIGLKSGVGYSNYESGKRQITLPRLMVLASHFDHDLYYFTRRALLDVGEEPQQGTSYTCEQRSQANESSNIGLSGDTASGRFLQLPPVRGLASGSGLADEIIATVSSYFGLSVQDLRAHNKERRFSDARKVACYLMREYFSVPFSVIARSIGRDSSTAFYSHKKLTAELGSDPQLGRTLTAILGNLESGSCGEPKNSDADARILGATRMSSSSK
jgi:cell division protein FtsZ